MKKNVNLIMLTSLIVVLFSCTKDSMSVSCYVCSTDVESIDVCEEDGDFLVDGEIIENPNNVSLEDFIIAIEANPEDNPDVEGVSCRRK